MTNLGIHLGNKMTSKRFKSFILSGIYVGKGSGELMLKTEKDENTYAKNCFPVLKKLSNMSEHDRQSLEKVKNWAEDKREFPYHYDIIEVFEVDGIIFATMKHINYRERNDNYGLERVRISRHGIRHLERNGFDCGQFEEGFYEIEEKK